MRVSARVVLCCFVFLGVFCPGGLFAKVEDHFKKALSKDGNHQIRNIDFIYMINLDERPEKVKSKFIGTYKNSGEYLGSLRVVFDNPDGIRRNLPAIPPDGPWPPAIRWMRLVPPSTSAQVP